MTKQYKIKYAQCCVAKDWLCAEDSFAKSENVIFETDKSFFEIATFGCNAVIRADKSIINWCIKNFADVPANEILDGENLYTIESKMREHGKKLGGEHTRFLHLIPENKTEKPQGFSFEWLERNGIQILYSDKRFDSALNYQNKGEVLALVAKKDDEIVSIVAVDDYSPGFWQIGVDTIKTYKGKGLAAYLVKEMALESEKRNQTPFYTTWMPNIASVRTAISAGFIPVWMGYCAENI